MFRIGTENPWFCSYGFDMLADFCLWILDVDGLQVPPFEHHSGGSGALQTLGLNADNWSAWMRKVISTHDLQQHKARQQSAQLANRVWKEMQAKGGLPGTPGSEEHTQALHNFNRQVAAAKQAQPHVFFPCPVEPAELWSEDVAISQKLAEMWKAYGPVSNTRRTWEGKLQAERSHDPSHNLWNDLKPYHERLEGLIIHFVEYSQPIEFPVAPLSVVMTIVDEQLDYETLCERTLRAAEALAANATS